MTVSSSNPADGLTIRLYSATEIARALGCSEWWVKEQARKRRIPFTWIGGQYRFTVDHLAEIVQAFEVLPGSAHSGSSRRGASRRQLPAASASPTNRLTARPPKRSRNARQDAA